jgi:hypothetical protein
MSLTLEKIMAEHLKIGKMIEEFKANAVTVLGLPEVQIELRNGEHYAGIIIGKDGEPSHHLILLPGDAEDIKWKDAKAWAEEQGGSLPTRREQSLLYANLKEQFQGRWYWSNEEHATDSDYAWFQNFLDGYQFYHLKDDELRARAVRRLVIE